MALYSCDGGYALSNGNSERTCVGSPLGPGEWNGVAPICERKHRFFFSQLFTCILIGTNTEHFFKY